MFEFITRTISRVTLKRGPIALLGAVVFLAATATSAEAPHSNGDKPEFAKRQYMVGPGDQLEIKLFYNPELNTAVTVDPGGDISLQLIGTLHAADMSVPDLQQLIESKYGTQLAKPQVSLVVKVFGREHVFVHGEVGRPGVVELTGTMTVLQAIAGAGGLKDTAREKEVLIIRFPRGYGSPTVIKADLRGTLHGQEPMSDLVLAPMDQVFVPRSKIANVNLWVDQYIRKNIPVTAGVLWSPFGAF